MTALVLAWLSGVATCWIVAKFRNRRRPHQPRLLAVDHGQPSIRVIRKELRKIERRFRRYEERRLRLEAENLAKELECSWG
jgi:hypothetical protein